MRNRAGIPAPRQPPGSRDLDFAAPPVPNSPAAYAFYFNRGWPGEAMASLCNLAVTRLRSASF
jgi:hypothetical protein